MRCSLLALSSYIDTELDLEPAGELEAHLVACDRCRTAIGHLREESARIGALARVHVPDDAVHDLFSQIGLIAEEDDLPKGPAHRDRPASVEAPPWFGAERGAALPWAPRPTGHEQSQPRELIGERAPATAVAEPPELLLWDESIDQIVTAAPAPPPVHIAPAPEPELPPEVDPDPVPFVPPQPPQVVHPEPQPPDLSTSAPLVAAPGATAPRLAAGPNPFQRLRDAVAVRFALRRGAGSGLDSGVEIVSGVGAPRWDQRARPRHWNDRPPIVTATAPAIAESPSPPPVAKPSPFSRFMARVTAEPADAEPAQGDPADEVPLHQSAGSFAPSDSSAEGRFASHDAEPATRDAVEATAPLELADVLSEVASLAAPLERTHTPIADAAPTTSVPTPSAPGAPATSAFEHLRATFAPAPAPEVETPTFEEADETRFGVDTETESTPILGRHVRRLHSQRSDRREWNPTRPVTGRHVLPLGGPAVAAADRDRRLWLFGAVTVVLMLLGLLVGRQVSQTRPLVASTIPRSTPAPHAITPPTTAPLPVATPAPAPIVVVPPAPTPQQLTGAKTLGTGSSGFSVADVRYGEHLNDFRLVFDMAFPASVTGDPDTVIGYDGPTTLYVEFTGVNGASDIATMPPHQVVVSIVALPMARNSDRLIFKITLSKKAPFDAYFLSGGRLVIDVT